MSPSIAKAKAELEKELEIIDVVHEIKQEYNNESIPQLR